MCDFRDILGQEHIKQRLEQSIRRDQLSHSYLFLGEKGMGKQAMARAFAKRLLCTGEGMRPCGHCHSCIQLAADTHPDVITISRDKTTLGVDRVREQLSQEIRIRPFSGERRIFIIPEAEKMTQQAQNAILKTIEEPPTYAIIILLADQEEALLPTIRSRVLRLSFRPVPESEILECLRRKGADAKRAGEAARFSRGIYRRAEELALSEEAYARYRRTLDLLRALPKCGETVFHRAQTEITELYPEPRDFLNFLRLYYRDVLCVKSGGSSEALIFPQEEEALIREAKDLSYEQAGVILKETEAAEKRFRLNVNKELSSELLLLAIRRE